MPGCSFSIHDPRFTDGDNSCLTLQKNAITQISPQFLMKNEQMSLRPPAPWRRISYDCEAVNTCTSMNRKG